MQESRTMKSLPPYLFARIEQKISEAKEKGIDVINLGIGDPDLPTPRYIVDRMAQAIYDSKNHQYPSSAGMLEYRKAVAGWYEKRYGVVLDPKTEVISLIGSKEGIAHISFAYLDKDDINLVPDPGYPVYGISTILAGGKPYTMPLREENGFLPVLEDIPSDVAKKAKLMFINYPNNPTGAVASRDFFEKIVEFARSFDILVCHDAAYSEIVFDGIKPLSFLEVKGAKDIGIEFNSLSKPFNMTGWRIGFAVGNRDALEVLGRFKSNVDSGVFQAVQYAAIEALEGPEDHLHEIKKVYQKRRDLVAEGLRNMGFKVSPPKGSFYFWVKVPEGYTSASFAEMVLEKTAVVLTPGSGYGEHGEGYFRIALTVSDDRLAEALGRMEKALGKVEF